MKTLSTIAIGGVSGLAGAAVMSAMMAAGKLVGLVDTPIPHQVERRLESKLDVSERTGPASEIALAQAMHFGLGAAHGIVYSFLLNATRLQPAILGPIYGLSTYVIDEVFAGPSLGLTQKPTEQSRRTVWRRILMKLAFGISVYLIYDGISRRIDPEPRS
jgi:hypothetical protein